MLYEVITVHLVVGLAHAVLVDVEGVGIFHDEFARTHDAEARTDFVAELGLDLVVVDGQLLVAAQLAPRGRRPRNTVQQIAAPWASTARPSGRTSSTPTRSRITSYNVCYTKLLRTIGVKCAYRAITTGVDLARRTFHHHVTK